MTSNDYDTNEYSSDGSEENERWNFSHTKSSLHSIGKDLYSYDPLGDGHTLVRSLDVGGIDGAVNRNKNVLIYFISADCPQCREFTAHFVAVARNFWTMEDDPLQLRVSFYEVTDRKLLVRFNLRELPTVFFFREGLPIVYEGELNADALQAWIFDHTEIMTWEINSKTFDEVINKRHSDNEGASSTWMIQFCDVDAVGCDGFYATWESAAYRLKDEVEFGYIDASIELELVKRLNIDTNELPVIILFKDGAVFRCTLTLHELTTDRVVHFATKGHLGIYDEQHPDKLTAFSSLIVKAGANINVVVVATIAVAAVLCILYCCCRGKGKKLQDPNMIDKKGV